YTQKRQPGIEKDMEPKPIIIADDYKGSEKLTGKVALITGGDSGIGRSVAVHFAKEGADIAILHLQEEREDAEYTKTLIEKENVRLRLYSRNINKEKVRTYIVSDIVEHFVTINILVNDAGVQYTKKEFLIITEENLRETFETNNISIMFVSKFSLRKL